MGVRWERHDEFGPNPNEWPVRLAITTELGRGVTDARVAEIVDDLAEISARGSGTFGDLRATVRELVDLRSRGGDKAVAPPD